MISKMFYSNIRKIFAAFIFFFFSATLTFGKDDTSGERTAFEREFPYAICITDSDDNLHGTGTLLTRSKVSTAAHVAGRKFKVETAELIGGVVKMNTKELGYQKRKVRKFVTHPKYNKNKEPLHDIAYILAEVPFEINDFVKPAPLGGYNLDSFSKSWDRIVTNRIKCRGLAFNKNKELRSVRMYTVDKEKCEEYADTEWYSVGIRCLVAYMPDNVLCSGDSGGPLVCDDMVYGIYGDSSGGYPAVSGPDTVICDGIGCWFIYNTYGHYFSFFDLSESTSGYMPTPSLLAIAFSVMAPIQGTFFHLGFFDC